MTDLTELLDDVEKALKVGENYMKNGDQHYFSEHEEQLKETLSKLKALRDAVSDGLGNALEKTIIESAYQGATDNKMHHHFVLHAPDYKDLKRIKKAARLLHQITQQKDSV